MVGVISFQIFALLSIGWVGSLILRGVIPDWLAPVDTMLVCSLIGALGGCVYCLRAVYLNRCVEARWDDDWNTWYYLRPLVSFLVGGISFIFLKAGLLVLDSAPDNGSSLYGFLAFAFIAGLNVDNFMKKVEEIAETTWGVGKSRVARKEEQK